MKDFSPAARNDNETTADLLPRDKPELERLAEK
jgi:hypothetical protein